MENQFFGKLLKECCPICYDEFKSNAEVTFMLPCLRHPFHGDCVISYEQSQTGLAQPKQCPFCRTDATARLVIEIAPRPTLPCPNPKDIIEQVTVKNVNDLKDKFRPCCNSPFKDLDNVVFPGPCFNHPMHEKCYVIERVGDFSVEARAREVPCLTCGQILNDEVQQSLVL